MTTFGDKDIFALEYAFEPDPDRGRGATVEESHSWGRFALWVQGKNLCQFMHNDERSDFVHWYLLPFVEWLAKNWGPLLYEEAPPTPTEKGVSACSIFFEYGKSQLGFMPEREQSLWYDWGQRHSLRACASGGIFPDVYLRGAGENVEVSWGNASFPGVPDGLFFTTPADTALALRKPVNDVLYLFLKEVSTYLYSRNAISKRIQALRQIVTEIPINKDL